MLPNRFSDSEDGTQGAPIARTTSAGVHPYSSPAASSAAVHDPPAASADDENAQPAADAAPAPAVRPEDVPREVAPKVPLYKRKWFIIAAIVAALLGIAILFILLYPVVHAIAQHIVNVSVLNVDRAVITQPTNSS